MSINELNYGFKVRETISSFTETEISDLPAQRLKYRLETADVSAFVNVKTKIYYDARHIPLLIIVGDQTYLELHNGYELPGRYNKKISQQRCGFFRVFKKVNRSTYELEFFIAWKIYPIVSVV